MFLSKLSEKEKEKFLGLAYKTAYSDGVYNDQEIKLIKKFRNEVDLEQIPTGVSVDEAITFFADASEEVRKIVLFEIYGVAYANHGTIHEAKAEIINKIKAAFKLSDEKADELEDAAKQLEEAYVNAKAAINN